MVYSGDIAMGYALNHSGFGALAGQPASETVAKPGLLIRFYNAFMSARQRQADREIDRYFDRCGRVLTDSTEREMMQRTISGNWGVRG
jgi:hypothetical protein